jgi:hypothetical protein
MSAYVVVEIAILDPRRDKRIEVFTNADCG